MVELNPDGSYKSLDDIYEDLGVGPLMRVEYSVTGWRESSFATVQSFSPSAEQIATENAISVGDYLIDRSDLPGVVEDNTVLIHSVEEVGS